MFRPCTGFTSQYRGLTLLVVAEFNEWKILAYGSGVTLHGTRQFDEKKAKEHALAVADSYIRDEKHEDLASVADVQWLPTGHTDWLVWRS